MALGATCATAQPQAPDLARADALIRDGRYEAAWELLAPHEPRHAGRPEYDYLLGIAALESGRPGRATFILERVLASVPGHTAARLEMARGYIALGDRERAAREFRAVLSAAPTPATRAVAARYLERLEGGPRARALAAAYVEASLGRDSNVNAAPSGGALLGALPVAGPEADRFFALGAGASLAHELGGPYKLFAGADFRQRMHADAGAFDPRVAELRLGLEARIDERDRLRASLQHEAYDLGYDSLRRAQGVAVQWIRRLAPEAEFAAYVQALRIRYRDAAFSTESADIFLAGARGARELGAFVAHATLYAGQDDATAGRPDGDRALFGGAARLQRGLGARLDADAALSYQRSDYSASSREDTYLALELGVRWRFARGWTVRPEISRVHNRSNAPLRDYRRTEVALRARRAWD